MARFVAVVKRWSVSHCNIEVLFDENGVRTIKISSPLKCALQASGGRETLLNVMKRRHNRLLIDVAIFKAT